MDFKMFIGLVTFWSVNVVCVSSLVTNVSEMSCFTDRDCALSAYCSESAKCVGCYNCTKKNRENASMRCAKTYDQCGPCLPGFMENSFTVKMRCVPERIVAEHQTADVETNGFSLNPIWLVLAFTSITFGFASFYCYNKKNRVMTCNNWNESGCEFEACPPPPYHNDEYEIDTVGNTFHLRIVESSDIKTTAVPFQPPRYESGTVAYSGPAYEISDDQTDTGSGSTTEISEPSFTAPSIDIHDETTTPSAWTPGTSYGAQNDDAKKEERVSPPNKRRKVEEENIELSNNSQ